MAVSLLTAFHRADVVLVGGSTVYDSYVDADGALSAFSVAGVLLGKFRNQMVTINPFGDATAVSEAHGAVTLTFYVSRSMKEEDVR